MSASQIFRLVILLSLPGLIVCPAAAAKGTVTPQELRCEMQSMPLGIATPQPRLSWSLRSDQRAAAQSRYQVLAASSPAKLAPDRADLWDSGEVASAESLNIVYAGKPLRSGQRVFWSVRVWDGATRLFHWMLVVLIGLAYVTRKVNPDLTWHMRIGYAILILIKEA